MISSELPEVLGMCDRVLVMRSGRISGEITDVACASQESIMSLAV
jgi:ribose transport system ATP-binding protein